MKNLTLVAFILLSSVAFAQTTQGWLYASGGGSLQFGSDRFESGGVVSFEDNVFGFSVVPTLGYFVADGIMIGGSLNFTNVRNTDKADDTNYTINRTLSVGPLVRYYHTSDFFAQGSAYFGSNKVTNSFLGTETSTNFNLFGWNVGVGRAIFFSEFVALEPMVLFQSNRSADADFPDNVAIDSGLMIMINLSVFIQ